VGATEGCDAKGFPENSYLAAPPKGGTRIFVRPNKYEPGRAHVCVFNWDNADKVPVDLSKVLKPGDTYEVRDSQDFLGPAIVRGTYEGKPVELPLGGTDGGPGFGHVEDCLGPSDMQPATHLWAVGLPDLSQMGAFWDLGPGSSG